MKRSGNVGLVLMGAGAFVATFAAGTAYFAWQKPSYAAQGDAHQRNCTMRPDGTWDCPPRPRGYSYHFFPSYFSGWWGRSASPGATPQGVALTSNSPAYSPAGSSDTVRSGFGTTARGPVRMSAHG